MIKAEGVRKDYADIVKENSSDSAKLVKIMRLVIELLLNIRTNQTPEGREKVKTTEKSESK